MLRMIVPRTSVCPVAVTVLGIPTAWKTPCDSNEPGVRSMKNKTIPKNFDFISYLFLKCADDCPPSHKTGFRAGERRPARWMYISHLGLKSRLHVDLRPV